MRIGPYIFVLAFILFISCKSSENTNQAGSILLNSEDPVLTDRIAFLNYKMVKNGDSLSISLISKIISEGRIKGYSSNSQYLNNGNLKCSQLNENSEILDVLYLPDPLIKDFEFVNENGSFERKTVSLDSSELNFRIQLYTNCSSILIEKIIDPELNLRKLLETKISEK